MPTLSDVFRDADAHSLLAFFDSLDLDLFEKKLFEKNGKPYLTCLATGKEKQAKPEGREAKPANGTRPYLTAEHLVLTRGRQCHAAIIHTPHLPIQRSSRKNSLPGKLRVESAG
ncbi:MAG: hypothetical protein PHU46_08825 [Rhodocyclaceae bacterium]|nr:hypothetical protein [Rhodocyclaceae bacterium]